MAAALLRRVYTRLDLSLFKSKHDYHGVGFEVEKRLCLAHIQLPELQKTHLFKSLCLLAEPACFCRDEFRICISSFGRAASGTERFWSKSEGQNLKASIGEEWGLLCHLAVLCEQTEILPKACICSSGFCPLAELWESWKEMAKCLNGSGKSRSLLTASSNSAPPSGRSWGVAALAPHNCRWLLVPCSGGTELLPATIYWATEKEKEVAKGKDWLRQKSGKRHKCAKKTKKGKKSTNLSCCACGPCMWPHALFGVMFDVGTGIYGSRLKDFFEFASVVEFIPQGKGICVWFGSFLLKAVLAPLSVSLPDKLNR